MILRLLDGFDPSATFFNPEVFVEKCVVGLK